MVRTTKFAAGLAVALLAAPACKKSEPTDQGAAKMAEPAPAAKAEPPKAEPPKPFTAEERAAHYATCWGHFNDRKWDEFGKCYSADAVSEHLDSGMPAASGAALHEGPKSFAAAFPDVKGTQFLTLVNGNKVASLSIMAGTHTAEWKMGPTSIPPTHKPVGYLFAHAGEYGDDNTLRKEWVFADAGTLMNQLGLSPMKARPVAKAEGTPTVVVAKDDATEKTNVEAYKKLADTWNKHDKAITELYADDAVVTDTSAEKDAKGKKEILAMGQLVWKGFPDAKGEILDVWGAGDYTVATVKNSGTNTGDVKEWKLKKTGKPISFTAFEINKWQNGKVVQGWVVWNSLSVAQQLGMAPTPPPAAAAAAPADGAKPAESAAKPVESEMKQADGKAHEGHGKDKPAK